MEEIAARLKLARAEKGFTTAQAAVDAFGFVRSTYYSHEGSSRGIPLEEVVRYAKAYGVTPEWIQFGDDDAKMPEDTDLEPAALAFACHQAMQEYQAAGQLKKFIQKPDFTPEVWARMLMVLHWADRSIRRGVAPDDLLELLSDAAELNGLSLEPKVRAKR